MTAHRRGSGLDDATDATLRASRALLGVVARSLSEALEHVSLPQFRVLVLLAVDGPLRSGVVAERMGIHPSTFSRNADRLVAGGWVRRVEDPDSRLSVLIELTDTGADLVDRVTRRRRAELREILATMPPETRDVLAGALESFADAAGEAGAGAADLTALGM
ncbi:MarR family transcriptional regulator [Actinotalea sp. M2MS4P-6]|uniref:MarR family winged helix-turn-helix transcriptional regulator n=1 Tax=Actinotalea sp. M2MS4P-6 TaxID=2983762 RepID=UPI0021E4D1A8|nr:MarR family transcriptional regulator [Actinotalea sp. M2MS4P-6]MCV2395607.1 MarR family transcriptional regulator [Actinotalea sp. M2MS4P-6]